MRLRLGCFSLCYEEESHKICMLMRTRAARTNGVFASARSKSVAVLLLLLLWAAK